MEFRHSFVVHAPLEAVRDFHRRADSMRRITPPPVWVQLRQAPETLGEGVQMDFTLWLGVLPLRWQARIENVSANGFDDRQVAGPFAEWLHRHRFEALDERATRVVDWVEAKLHPSLLRRLVGFLMWINLPLLFAYRAWRTRRLLQGVNP